MAAPPTRLDELEGVHAPPPAGGHVSARTRCGGLPLLGLPTTIGFRTTVAERIGDLAELARGPCLCAGGGDGLPRPTSPTRATARGGAHVRARILLPDDAGGGRWRRRSLASAAVSAPRACRGRVGDRIANRRLMGAELSPLGPRLRAGGRRADRELPVPPETYPRFGAGGASRACAAGSSAFPRVPAP